MIRKAAQLGIWQRIMQENIAKEYKVIRIGQDMAGARSPGSMNSTNTSSPYIECISTVTVRVPNT